MTEKDIAHLVEKYGERWVLRDLDFYPERVSDLSRIGYYKKSTWMEIVKDNSSFTTFNTELDAVIACVKVYETLGRIVPSEIYERYWKLNHKK